MNDKMFLKWFLLLVTLFAARTESLHCYARIPEISDMYLKATCVTYPLRRCMIFDSKNSPIFYGHVDDLYCIKDEL